MHGLWFYRSNVYQFFDYNIRLICSIHVFFVVFIFFLLRHSSSVPEIKIFSLFYLYYIPYVFLSPNTTITVVCVSCSSISFKCKHARPFWYRSRFSDRSLSSQGKGNRSFPVNSLSSFCLIFYFSCHRQPTHDVDHQCLHGHWRLINL